MRSACIALAFFALVAIAASAPVPNPLDTCNSRSQPDTCQVVKQEGVNKGDYCGWCEAENNAKVLEYTYYFCSGSMFCDTLGGSAFPVCQERPQYKKIGEACNPDDNIEECVQGIYNIYCLEKVKVCGSENVWEPGEKCTARETVVSDETCYWGDDECVNNVCQAIDTGARCTNTDLQCLSKDYCDDGTGSSSSGTGLCTTRKAPGQPCSSSRECRVNAECFANACVTYGTVKRGQPCDASYLCEQGSYCDFDLTNPVCAEDSTNDLCNFSDGNDDCDDESGCVCNWATGKAMCVGSSSGRSIQLAPLNCAASKGCDPEIDPFPGNCMDGCYDAVANQNRRSGPTDGLKGSESSSAASLALFAGVVIAAVAMAM